MDIEQLKNNPIKYLEEVCDLKLLSYQKEILEWLFANKENHISIRPDLSGVVYRRYMKELSGQIYDELRKS